MSRTCPKGKVCVNTHDILVIVALLAIIGYVGYLLHKHSVSVRTNLDTRMGTEQPNPVHENYTTEAKPAPVTLNMNTYVDGQSDPYMDTSSLQPFYGPKQMNALDRINNPLRYPYRSADFYDLPWYPNNELPFQVIGCGGRRGPCVGGTEAIIPNQTPMIDISNRNIAPINISTQGPMGSPQQVGFIYKAFGNKNELLPLFGRRKYANQDRWEYYTELGPKNVKVELVTRHPNQELNTNDEVYLAGVDKGNSTKYFVTIYERDAPQYIPYV